MRRCRSASEGERVKRFVFATGRVQSECPSLEEKIEHEPFANDAAKPTALGIHPNGDSDSAWVVSQAVDKTVDEMFCCNTGGREDESTMAEFRMAERDDQGGPGTGGACAAAGAAGQN